MNSTSDRLCTFSYDPGFSFGNIRFRQENFGQRVFSMLDDGKSDICLWFYLAQKDTDKIPVQDIRYYMRRFRRVPDFNRTVCFTGANIMSLPTQYLQYNIQSAVNMGLRPELLTDGVWMRDAANANKVFEMLGAIKIPRRFRRRGKKISLVIDGDDSDNTAAAITKCINSKNISSIIDVRHVVDITESTRPIVYYPDQDADIFFPKPGNRYELRFCFYPNKQVCPANIHDVRVGNIDYINDRGRYKSVFDIKFEMAMKIISDFKQKISR